jgi:hypothetical protein
MISSCANPVCYKSFHYLRSGHLYGSIVDLQRPLTRMLWMPFNKITPSQRSLFFWLARSVRPSCI